MLEVDRGIYSRCKGKSSSTKRRIEEGGLDGNSVEENVRSQQCVIDWGTGGVGVF